MDGMFDENQRDLALSLPMMASSESLATAVFTAALMAKGSRRPVENRESLPERLMQELRGMGLLLEPLPAPAGCCCSFSIGSLVVVCVMADRQEKESCLSRVRESVLSHPFPLGLLIDFNASLVVDGIMRVSLKELVEDGVPVDVLKDAENSSRATTAAHGLH